MSREPESCMPGSCDYWMVSQAAAKLGAQASTLGVRHIKDGVLRLQFNREIAYYAKSIVDDVSQGKKSPEQGLHDLHKEQKSLLSQSWEVAQKGVGVVAGALQLAAGAGICYGSVGTLCLFMGAPMMVHGANNMYENGRNLLEGRSDTEGPVRAGYRAVSKALGGDNCGGDIAYGTGDLITSAYGVGRLVLKPDSWRLFRYVRTDYVRGYQRTSAGGLLFDRVSDLATGKGVYDSCVNPND